MAAVATKGWEFKEAQELVAAMRSKVNQYGYDISLGGGVLFTGKSAADLDLFFIPRVEGALTQPVELLMWIASKLGVGRSIVTPPPPPGAIAVPVRTGAPAPPTFSHKLRFDLAGRKIDVFVL